MVKNRAKTKRPGPVSFERYIHRVVKAADSGDSENSISLSAGAMNTLEFIVQDLLDRIITESTQIINANDTKTILPQTITTAVKLIFPRDGMVSDALQYAEAKVKAFKPDEK